MKARVITTLYRIDGNLRPDLGGQEAVLYDNTMPRSVNFAVSKDGDAGAGDEILLSLGGEEEPVKRILDQSTVEVVDREQVEAWRRGRFDDPSAEWGQARDLEVDRRLAEKGINPDQVRSAVQFPSKGKALLQDQEYHAVYRLSAQEERRNAEDMPTIAHQRSTGRFKQKRRQFFSGKSVTVDQVETRIDELVSGDDERHTQFLKYARGDKEEPF